MRNKERFFRVKYGYKASDQVSIKEADLEKALYAQITGNPVQLGSSFVKGSAILAITPHYHKHTGWHEWYEPSDGDDWLQIKRDCPPYEGIVEHYKERIQWLMQNNQQHLIGKNHPIDSIDRLLASENEYEA